ncbi:MAG: adenylate/guanylate cyclase domain-containing protein [Acidimicrobiia bacterium]
MRVQRCFAFVDLSGFTAFTENRGDERAVLVLAEMRTVMREIAARRGVRVVKWLGDGAMLSSTDVDGLTAAIIEIGSRMDDALPTLAMRAGMDAGPVIMFEGDDYIGRPVNVASRLCDQARPHELLATATLVPGLPAWVEASPAPPVQVKGFDATIDLVRLSIVDAGDDPVTDPVCGLTIPRATAVQEASTWFCSAACAGSARRADPAVVRT